MWCTVFYQGMYVCLLNLTILLMVSNEKKKRPQKAVDKINLLGGINFLMKFVNHENNNSKSQYVG